MNDEHSLIGVIKLTEALKCSDNHNPYNHPPQVTRSIIAKVISDKQVNNIAFKNTILRAWGLQGNTTVNTIDSNIVVVVLECPVTLKMILSQTWNFKKLHIVTVEWPIEKALHEVDLSKTTFWIQVSNLPIIYVNEAVAKLIGDSVGPFIKTDITSEG
ncbi:hypothetical protein CDL12_10191 [Handroanthus impetiginosus]|uniref:Uncharacterized protein n=1 Tax=Handroanthus impetiginosus TaxID=429701 RepID=A0A2G9HHZ5_9LAMI|nr:hypothetical protein CDL12_10191 [Handroanthus impetiginosus]